MTVKFNNYLYTFVLIKAALLFSLLSARGDMPEATISLEFSLLSLGSTLRDLHFDTVEGRQTVTITNAARSHSIRYTGSPNLIFYRLGEPDALGDETISEFARINLTQHRENLLLLFLPTSDDDKARIHPLKETLEDFPNGSWRLFNLTTAPLAVAVRGGEPLIIPNQELRTLQIDSDRARTRRVEIAIYREEGWEMIYRSLWSHRPDSRTLVFLTPQGENTERIRVNRFTDSLSD